MGTRDKHRSCPRLVPPAGTQVRLPARSMADAGVLRAPTAEALECASGARQAVENAPHEVHVAMEVGVLLWAGGARN